MTSLTATVDQSADRLTGLMPPTPSLPSDNEHWHLGRRKGNAYAYNYELKANQAYGQDGCF